MERKEESVICLIYTSEGRRRERERDNYEEEDKFLQTSAKSFQGEHKKSAEADSARKTASLRDIERGHRLREMKPWAGLISWPVIDPSIKDNKRPRLSSEEKQVRRKAYLCL
ncbi:hypothetical protein PanWU01x14_108750 [Parasponia andersonii]|uniref:Uncharacterized protein n=1 Tax=Parasponia andersonii TaxID=3476 RepID=A0A2P5D021_PARAD|nr:hypothetical protein PanWU01x14_108750 [Parasponia andersonii]